MSGTMPHDAVSAYPPKMMNANYGKEMRAIYHWPLHIWGDDDLVLANVECDYCGHELWASKDPNWEDVERPTLDVLYRAVSQHRLDGCPEAPESGETQ